MSKNLNESLIYSSEFIMLKFRVKKKQNKKDETRKLAIRLELGNFSNFHRASVLFGKLVKMFDIRHGRLKNVGSL